MQSILSTAPTKSSTLVASNDSKITEADTGVDETSEVEKEGARFSELLDSFREDEIPSDSDLQSSEKMESEDLFADEALTSSELFSKDIELEEEELPDIELEEGELPDIELPDTETVPENIETESFVGGFLQQHSHEGVLAEEDEISDKQSTIDIDQSDKEVLSVAKDGSDPRTTPLHPILAQIETAQKIDTKVSEAKSEITAEVSESTSKSPNKLSDEVNKRTQLDAENGLNDETQESTIEADTNKLQSLISSLKTESEKHSTHQNQALSVATQLTTSAEQVVNKTVNTTSLIQSATLQQPLELQSKQASSIMGEKIMMMINQGKQEVSIRLDPAELGSMHIKLQIQQDQLQVTIHTQVAQSRDIIEQHLPKLREQLAQQGINLGEASVEQQSKQDQSPSQQSQHETQSLHGTGRGKESLLENQSEWVSTQIVLPAQGIDYYA